MVHPVWLPLHGLLPDNTGIHWELSNLGGGQTTITHLLLTKANLTSRSIYDFQTYNFMNDSFKLYSASYRIGTFIY